MVSRLLLRTSSKKPSPSLSNDKLSKCLGINVFSLSALVMGSQTMVPEFQPACLWFGFGIYMGTVGLQKSVFRGPLNKLAVQLNADNPQAARAVAIASVLFLTYVVCFSIASSNGTETKQIGAAADQPVLAELNGWMAHEMYLQSKVRLPSLTD